jgi:predicted GIY-YIG superfamily endonuclease
MDQKNYYCYIISNQNDRTYNGYTVNLERRLKQHNGLLKGGAKATHKRGPWDFLIVITSNCWDCISTAMQHEWSIKYPTRKRPRPKEYNGRMGRLLSLEKVFEHMEKKECTDIVCYVHNDYIDIMNDISRNFEFVSIKSLQNDLYIYEK